MMFMISMILITGGFGVGVGSGPGAGPPHTIPFSHITGCDGPTVSIGLAHAAFLQFSLGISLMSFVSSLPGLSGSFIGFSGFASCCSDPLSFPLLLLSPLLSLPLFESPPLLELSLLPESWLPLPPPSLLPESWLRFAITAAGLKNTRNTTA